MAAVVTCPHCNACLRTANAVAPGKKLTCPKCKTAFVASGHAKASVADEDEAPPRRPRQEAAAPSLGRRKRDVDEDEEEDLPSRSRSRTKQSGKKNKGKSNRVAPSRPCAPPPRTIGKRSYLRWGTPQRRCLTACTSRARGTSSR